MENPGQGLFTRAISISASGSDEPTYRCREAPSPYTSATSEKTEINPPEPRYIKAVWGQGYKMERVN